MATGTAYIKLSLLRFTGSRSILTTPLQLPLLEIISGEGRQVGGSASISLPGLTVVASGIHGFYGSTVNNVRLPSLIISSTGLHGIVGGSPNPLLLPLLRITNSVPGPRGSAYILLRPLKIISSGGGGLVGSASISLPLLLLSGDIYFNPKGSAALSLPLLSIVGAGDELLDVKILSTPIRRGFAMNLVNWAVTEYEDYPFNSFAYFNGLQLGAKEDGIFILDGPDDNGQDILAYIETGTEDLFKNFIMRLREAWVESRQDGPLLLKVIEGEEETSPVCERPIESVSRKMHEERVKFPRGLKGRYAAFRFENVEGSDVSLKSIKIFLEKLPRRR